MDPEMAAKTDRSAWKSVVVHPGEDRAAVERAFDEALPTTVAERVALAWQLSVEAGKLAGWSTNEPGLPRSHRGA